MPDKKLSVDEIINARVKPILKWAGGKSQLLKHVLPLIPENYGSYIEPFVGGGALFFALKPEKAVIADSNPELINCYLQVAQNVEDVIARLANYDNTEDMFYKVRAQDWNAMSSIDAAARMIYLNKTCFNGLYRVNRRGEFNSPYGRYANPTICDADGLRMAASVLSKATILCEDYKKVLNDYAKPGDFVFFDPPYVPVSEYADFKRYTKEQFYEKDHRELAKLTGDLKRKGVSMILTNSNAPLVTELYGEYPSKVVQSKRCISSKSDRRTGEDVIVTIKPNSKISSNAIHGFEGQTSERNLGAGSKI